MLIALLFCANIQAAQWLVNDDAINPLKGRGLNWLHFVIQV